jgi:hypothetical protein
MAETEIIKLKKELHHLKVQNAELLNELEEKNIIIGELETNYNKMKNETYLITKTKMMQQQEIIKLNVEKIIEEEKMKMFLLEKNLKESFNKIEY